MPLFSPHPSTRAMYTEGRRSPGYTFFDWVHGYIYGRFPYLYIGIGTGEHPLGRLYRRLYAFFARLFPPRPARPGDITFADTYHGKVVPLSTARELVSVREEISISYPEQVIPYHLARDLILHDPDHLVALDCPCRVSRPNPCLPLDVCLVVGEPFASFVIEHHPRRSRWINRDEAVAILKAEEERGHVHHAFFKEAMLNRFYAICNCCSCCCGAMQIHSSGTPMLASSGYLSQADEELCVGCGTCNEYCQFGALSLADGHASVNIERCMGCGVCISHCEQAALSLILAPEKGVPLSVPVLRGGI
jgi:Pyruvate/2-oxoacid:ferredoxin oxidoreductase delta subunit